RSRPRVVSGNTGKVSTSVVFMSAPPAVTEPSNTIGLSLARAAYRAAVYPAGPEPIMMTSRTSVNGAAPLWDRNGINGTGACQIPDPASASRHRGLADDVAVRRGA